MHETFVFRLLGSLHFQRKLYNKYKHRLQRKRIKKKNSRYPNLQRPIYYWLTTAVPVLTGTAITPAKYITPANGNTPAPGPVEVP